MATNADNHPDPERFQFTLRTLLLIVTVTCVLLGILEWLLPKSLPLEIRLTLYVSLTVVIAYGHWTVYRARRRPWKTPNDYVIVKVDAKWKQRVSSPLIFGPIAALTGVSLTFAPAYLLWYGQVQNFGIVEWIVVPLCFLVIYVVPGFYMRLASEVIAELRKSETPPSGS